jgi:hypothetical protein
MSCGSCSDCRVTIERLSLGDTIRFAATDARDLRSRSKVHARGPAAHYAAERREPLLKDQREDRYGVRNEEPRESAWRIAESSVGVAVAFFEPRARDAVVDVHRRFP